VTAFVLTAVALTLSVPASLTTVSQEQEPPWRHIQELARAGQYQDALAEMEHLLSKDPDNPRAWFLSGLLLQRIGQPLQAQGQLERAVSLAPNEPHYRMVCAELQLRNGYRFRARETLAPLLDDAHWGDLAHDQLWFLADLFYRTEQPEAASRALESYARLRPDDPRLPFRRGQIALSSSDLRAAEAAFREALRQGYHAREAAYGLALVLFQSGELEEAAGILNGFLNQAGDDPELAQLYASVLLGLDRPQEALDCLRRVEHLAANFPDLYETTARAYSRLGNREKALEYRQRFTELDRQRREVGEDSEKIHSLLQAGQEFLKQGQAEEARKRFEEVLQIDPDQVMALGYLVGIYSGRKESEKAENLLRRLQATAPEAFDPLPDHSRSLRTGRAAGGSRRRSKGQEHSARILRTTQSAGKHPLRLTRLCGSGGGVRSGLPLGPGARGVSRQLPGRRPPCRFGSHRPGAVNPERRMSATKAYPFGAVACTRANHAA